jgi:transposase-like protein
MSARRYRSYSVGFKLQLVQAYLAGEGSLKAVAGRHGVHHACLVHWLDKHRRGELAEEDQLVEQVRDYEAQIGALERKVGQLTMELDAVKKGLRALPSTPSGPLSIISGPEASPSREGVAL